MDETVPAEIREMCRGLINKDEVKRFNFEQLLSFKIMREETQSFLSEYSDYSG